MEINGNLALSLATEVSKIPDGTFDIAFFSYSRGVASPKLKIYQGCKTRKQLPEDSFAVASDNFFLFTDATGRPKMCYRYLIRYMSFPQDKGQLRKVIWID